MPNFKFGRCIRSKGAKTSLTINHVQSCSNQVNGISASHLFKRARSYHAFHVTSQVGSPARSEREFHRFRLALIEGDALQSAQFFGSPRHRTPRMVNVNG